MISQQANRRKSSASTECPPHRRQVRGDGREVLPTGTPTRAPMACLKHPMPAAHTTTLPWSGPQSALWRLRDLQSGRPRLLPCPWPALRPHEQQQRRAWRHRSQPLHPPICGRSQWPAADADLQWFEQIAAARAWRSPPPNGPETRDFRDPGALPCARQ